MGLIHLLCQMDGFRRLCIEPEGTVPTFDQPAYSLLNRDFGNKDMLPVLVLSFLRGLSGSCWWGRFC